MSSSNLQSCAFCTYDNVPGSKICEMCEKPLEKPLPKALPKVIVCPGCSLFNETFYDTCKICGTDLADGSSVSGKDSASGVNGFLSGKSSHGASSSASSSSKQNGKVANVCGKCCQKYPSDVFIMVCQVCTYYNLADTVQCLICTTRYGPKQEAVLSKVCPYCNYDETVTRDCDNCTYNNSVQNVDCALCGKRLQKIIFEESSHCSVAKELPETGHDGGFKNSVCEPHPHGSIENMSFEFAEGVSLRNGHIASNISSGVDVTRTVASSSAGGKTNPKYDENSFEILEVAPRTHKYYDMKSEAKSAKFMRAVATNIEILKTSAPSGVWIKCYEDRMDLISFMIEGPHSTPYENGLFIFDIHLPPDFPFKPPIAHYISFWGYRLNPNLYVEGKVCVSLLGTWYAERKEEQWRPTSTLLQLIVSIQGLILVEEPYFNEPGYANQIGTPEGIRNSAMYNEGVIVGMIDSTTALIYNPPPVFRKDIIAHFSKCGARMYERLQTIVRLMENPPSLRQLEKFRLAVQSNVNANMLNEM